ncbi:MAG: hypothetical protein KJ574_04920 [Nanoarchaeota archaeon]|nr:hypothetical protein [Nanoarchaeota archaeon]
MIEHLLGKRKKKAPVKAESKTVSARQYNGLIEYYTKEMESLRREITQVREQNTLIMKTAMKQGERVTELEERNKQLAKENASLKAEQAVKAKRA